MFGYNSYPAYQMQANQNRINELQQYGNYSPYPVQPTQATQQQVQVIKGRPVSSYDEAKASMIDLDGSLFVFPDIANKRIYTKQIMLDGTADFRTYVLEQSPQGVQPVATEQVSQEYVLRRDFENTVNQLIKEINSLKGGVSDEWKDTSNVKPGNEK